MSPLSQITKRLDEMNAPEPVKHPFRVLRVLGQDLLRCDLLKQASAMAYVTLLSLIPSLVAIFCVLSLFAPLMGNGDNLIDIIKNWILTNLAADSGSTVVHTLEGMLGNLSLAKIGWSSFASVLVTLILLLRQIELALNRIWLVHKGRNVFTRFIYFWTFLTLGIVVIAIGLGVSSGFDPHRLFGTAEVDVKDASHSLSWLLGFLAPFFFFFFLYKVVPNCTVRAKAAALGAGIAAFLLIQGGRFYGFYIRDAKNYATLYGALAQLPLFLTWLYICWIIILLGALISWRTQEGFPKEEDEDTLDAADTPLEILRNVQVKSRMPLIALVAIYQHFRQGTGKGLCGQELAHALKLPTIWVSEALEALEAMGYVVAAKGQDDGGNAGTVSDPYFPARPPESLHVGALQTALARPMTEWLGRWHHELPVNVVEALRAIDHAQADASFDDILSALSASA